LPQSCDALELMDVTNNMLNQTYVNKAIETAKSPIKRDGIRLATRNCA